MDFLNGNTIVLSHKYQLRGFSLFNCKEFMGVLYYFKAREDFF